MYIKVCNSILCITYYYMYIKVWRPICITYSFRWALRCVLQSIFYSSLACFYWLMSLLWLMTATMTSLRVYVSCERMNSLSREGWLKLVLLEWSESEYDGKFGFSMLQIFWAIGATSGVWQHFSIFAWWHVQVIFNLSSIKRYIKIWILFSFIVTLFRKSLHVISSLPYLINIL